MEVKKKFSITNFRTMTLVSSLRMVNISNNCLSVHAFIYLLFVAM